jgi:hypothetical protein
MFYGSGKTILMRKCKYVQNVENVSLNRKFNLLYKNVKILWESFFEFSILDIYFCPFLKILDILWQKYNSVTIIEN